MPKPKPTVHSSASSVVKAAKTRPKASKSSSSEYDDLISRMINVETFKPLGVKLGIYGHSGTGKTRALSSFAELGPMLHMVCSSNRENEVLSITGTKGITAIQIREPEELSTLVRYAMDNDFATVALDHVTEFTNLVLSRIIGLEKMPEQSSWGLATQQQYAQMGIQVKEYLRELFDFEGNVIILGQERTYDVNEDEDDLKPTVSIASTPSVAGWIAPACDYFVRTFKRHETESKTMKVGKGTKAKEVTKTTQTGRVEYCLAVGPDPIYMTKFRVPRGTDLPDVIPVGENDSVCELLSPYFAA